MCEVQGDRHLLVGCRRERQVETFRHVLFMQGHGQAVVEADTPQSDLQPAQARLVEFWRVRRSRRTRRRSLERDAWGSLVMNRGRVGALSLWNESAMSNLQDRITTRKALEALIFCLDSPSLEVQAVAALMRP